MELTWTKHTVHYPAWRPADHPGSTHLYDDPDRLRPAFEGEWLEAMGKRGRYTLLPAYDRNIDPPTVRHWSVECYGYSRQVSPGGGVSLRTRDPDVPAFGNVEQPHHPLTLEKAKALCQSHEDEAS